MELSFPSKAKKKKKDLQYRSTVEPLFLFTAVLVVKYAITQVISRTAVRFLHLDFGTTFGPFQYEFLKELCLDAVSHSLITVTSSFFPKVKG